MSVHDGEIVQVVLDVVTGEDSAGHFARVLVQGVFPRDAADLPAPAGGADRNVIRVFLGRDMRGVSAFRIGLGELPAITRGGGGMSALKGLRCRLFGCDWRSVVAGLGGPYRFYGEQCARCGRWYRPGPFLTRAPAGKAART